jgi:hypothetical protein
MNLDDFGTLRIRATSASGAIPIMGAIVRIMGGEESNIQIVKSLVTDNDGITPKVKLPTPKRSYSLTPEDEESPFALYDVEVTADGYYAKRIIGVAIFSGINAILPVNMIPESDSRLKIIHEET